LTFGDRREWLLGEGLTSDGVDGDEFARHVVRGLGDGVLAIGASRHGGIGAVYLFRRIQGDWTPVEKLVPLCVLNIRFERRESA
jgi:hypothetical protein